MATEVSYAKNWKTPFFTIWTGQALSLVGSRIAMFALIWWVTDTTGSATVLALASLFAMLPQIVLGPIAGAYVDRWNRRTVMMVADSLIALVSLWLVYLFWSGSIEVWHVYTIMLVRELGGIFHWPAMQASTSLMVPKEHLARVSGVNQAMFGMLNIVGPALGALLLSLTAMHNVMLLEVVTAAFAIAPLFFIRIPQPEPQINGSGVEKPSIWQDIRAGGRYLFAWKGLMLLTAVALIIKVALTPAFSLLPILTTKHFGGEAAELATMESVFGIGLVLGGLLLGVWGGFKRRIYTSSAGVFVIGVGLLVVGLLPSSAYTLAVAALFFIGASVAMTDGPLFAILQSTVAPEMQGRVFMLFGSVITLSSPVGLAIAGPVSDAIGVQIWYVVAGILCIAGTLVLFVFPSVRNIEDFQWQAEAGQSGAGSSAEPEVLPAAQPIGAD